MLFHTNKFSLGNEAYNLINVNYKAKKEEELKKLDSIHHIHVIDRSLSMEENISELISNVKETLNHISEKDLVSVIWFSSQDSCKILFKGASVHNKTIIESKLDTIASCEGLTCFSEPLKLVKEIIDDLKDINPNFNICFFTDGETVTDWTQEEEENRIFNILDEINNENKILSLNTIGFGKTYNEVLLQKMSSYSSFGTFNHSTGISDYSKIFSHEYKKIKDNVIHECKISAKDADILYITPNDSNLFRNTFETNTINKIKNQFFIVTKEEEFTVDGQTYNVKDSKKVIQTLSYTNFLYCYAKELYKYGEQHKAIDVLIQTRDKYLIDKALKSFTRDERLETVKAIASCYPTRKNRFKDGEVDENYVPEDDSYNVISFLSELALANAIYFPVEKYNRITDKLVESNTLFTKTDKVVASAMSQLTFNEKYLNVSIPYKINGVVNIDPQIARSVGLDPVQKTYIHRMQTIIRDGQLNVPNITVEVDLDKLSENAKRVVCKNGRVTSTGKILSEVDLSELPITNRVTSNLSISEILFLTNRLVKLKSRRKALKYIQKNLDVTTKNNLEVFIPNTNKTINAEQTKVLMEHGLNSKREYIGFERELKESVTNKPKVRKIEFAIKGCSSIPKITDSIKKQENGKKLNIMDEEILKTLSEYKNSTNVMLINMQLLSLQEKIHMISTMLFAAKVSKVLTGGWWTGLTSTPKADEYEENGIVLQVKSKYE